MSCSKATLKWTEPSSLPLMVHPPHSVPQVVCSLMIILIFIVLRCLNDETCFVHSFSKNGLNISFICTVVTSMSVLVRRLYEAEMLPEV